MRGTSMDPLRSTTVIDQKGTDDSQECNIAISWRRGKKQSGFLSGLTSTCWREKIITRFTGAHARRRRRRHQLIHFSNIDGTSIRWLASPASIRTFDRICHDGGLRRRLLQALIDIKLTRGKTRAISNITGGRFSARIRSVDKN